MADTLSKSASDQLVAEIRGLGQTQGLNAVFTTFLELMATSLASVLDPLNQEERNARHDEIVSGLPPEVVSSYARMCALMALAVREHVDDPCDILGKIYHELRLNNEWNGQFFSPDDICRMMAMIVNPVDDKHIKENGYMTINDPTCGSGAMLIGSIWAMKQRGIDFKKECLLVGQDIDIRCVWMAYIQLCLYEIPAIVIHANTLTMEEWSYWYTPYSLPLITKKEDAHE